jgi:hypothetical protein
MQWQMLPLSSVRAINPSALYARLLQRASVVWHHDLLLSPAIEFTMLRESHSGVAPQKLLL